MLQVVHTERVFVCEDCNKSFKLKKTHRHHMQDHEGNYAKVCPLCNKGCKTNHYYKVSVVNLFENEDEFLARISTT